MNERNKLFNDGVDKNDGGLYHNWVEDLVSVPEVAERTVFYDSNVAFTDGSATISVTGTKTVPNLYDTLKGLNQRIDKIKEGGTSICGITTTINKDKNNVTMKAIDNSTDLSLTIDATAIKFQFTSGVIYSMEDIFEMLEELRARTHAIKTNVTRVGIVENYISANAVDNTDLWPTNTIAPTDEQ